MKNIRIGNIEYKGAVSLDGEEYEEIVRWYPNSYYGSEERMKSEGWTFDENGDATSPDGFCHVHSGMFKSKELCYSIATIDWNRARDEFDVVCVGLRPFELEDESKDDYADFRTILKMIAESTDGED